MPSKSTRAIGQPTGEMPLCSSNLRLCAASGVSTMTKVSNNVHAGGYRFPFFVPVAALEFKQSSLSSPFMCPLARGGLVFSYSNNLEVVRQAIQGVELATLSIILIAEPENVYIREYDFSVSKKFQHLLDLRGYLQYKYAATPTSAEEDFLELVDLARYRHREVLSSSTPDIYTFNKNQVSPQPYQIVLMNITDFPFERIDEGLLADFLHAAFAAGIIVFAYGDTESIRPSAKRGASLLLDRMPVIDFTISGVKVRPEELAAEILPKAPGDSWTLRTIDDSRGLLVDFIKQRAAGNEEAGHDFLSVPIGTSLDGRHKIHFALGQKSGNYHALIVGNTGTGKTTLLNNIITEIARKYTSKQVLLYLMDYKEGVEFQIFNKHPNVAKVFLDNKDYNAAFNMLNSFASLIENRGALFKTRGVRDIDEHNSTFPDEALPHMVLIIDEAQKLFSDDYSHSHQFDNLLLDVASRGRSFGIHIILSTQNILDMDISPRTLEQITLRIAFRLSSERAAYKVLGYENLAPLSLGKYEFVYNPAGGTPDANMLGRAAPPADFASVIQQALSMRSPDEIVVTEVVTSTASNSYDDATTSTQAKDTTSESLLRLLGDFDEIDRQLDLQNVRMTPENISELSDDDTN